MEVLTFRQAIMYNVENFIHELVAKSSPEKCKDYVYRASYQLYAQKVTEY